MERARTNSRIRGQSRTILKKTTSGRTRIANPSMSSFRIFSPLETSIMVFASPRAERFAKMGDNSVMTAPMIADSDLELFREELDAMKRDVASLIERMKGVAANTVQHAARPIKRRVRTLRQEVGAQGDRSAKAVSLFIENQPVAAVSIAVAVGYIGARLFRR
jgi:ElaB/YqjD/DUF883 family membrane-anchored ribosome-binding protein